MTLECATCAGAVELVEASEFEHSTFERYECVLCGAEGTMSMNTYTGTTHYHGCLRGTTA